MGHTDIDKSPSLHNQSIGFIQSIGSGTRSTSAGERPKNDAKDHESKKSDDAKTASGADATTTASVAKDAAKPASPSSSN
jgi:hypothetical protein